MNKKNSKNSGVNAGSSQHRPGVYTLPMGSFFGGEIEPGTFHLEEDYSLSLPPEDRKDPSPFCGPQSDEDSESTRRPSANEDEPSQDVEDSDTVSARRRSKR